MYTIQLTKQTETQHLAHLYEHIFYIHIDTMLRSEGWFAPVDYSLDAYTDAGVISIVLDLYDGDLVDTFHEIIRKTVDIDIDFDMEITSIAIRQLEAEYNKLLVIKSEEKLEQSLRKIHKIEWLVNAKNIKSGQAEFHDDKTISLGDDLDVKTIAITFPLGHIDQTVRPLCRQIAGLIANTLISDLADTYGGFVVSEAYQVNDNHELEAVLKLAKSTKLTTGDIDTLYREVVQELSEGGGFGRLIKALRHIDTIPMPPSNERTYEDTGVMMDNHAWGEIATDDNLRKILAELKYDVTAAF